MRYSKNGKADKSVGLIETWDVLKFCDHQRKNGGDWLIETWDVLKFPPSDCIRRNFDRLIETWDVLKWTERIRRHRTGWLIETWDVLKY